MLYANTMPSTSAIRSGLRAVTRDAIRAELTQRALSLLDERGFDETTVEDIATAVGISPRSFFRYFPTKEDVVIGDLMPLGHLIEEALLARPEGEKPWVSLRASLAPLVRKAESDPENVLRSTRVALSTAGLRGRTIERHTAWATVLAPIVARRFESERQYAAMAAAALTQSALACLYVATVEWVAVAGRTPYADLLDAAFEAVGQLAISTYP
jgi:AcrR family transcriptional regulator